MSGSNGNHRNDDFDLVDALSYSSEVDQTKTVILAGGKGTRLRPYTAVLPKPLMPIGERAILELLVHELAEQGFVDITLSVGHLAHLIEAVFGNGDKYGVDLTYIREDTPLGTAGSLRLVDGLDETFLVLNGDLVTSLEYGNLVRSHRASGNILTIASKNRQAKMDYGVLKLERGAGPIQTVVGYQEKPVFDCMVSMGIYVLEPEALEFIPDEGSFDFPDLVQALLAAGQPVGSYVHNGLWLDIGRHDDYEQAVALWESRELGSLTTNGSSEAARSEV